MIEALSRPAHHEDRAGGPEIWVDEAIWGHRLYDEQTPWLTLLEFLGVLNSQHVEGLTLKELMPNTLSYRPQTQLRLRNLLFNNPHIAPVLASQQSDEAMWADWISRMKQNAGGLHEPSFAYLKAKFGDFREFEAVISFLQSSAIEGDSNKRWSSKFVFPFGPNAFYEDVSVGPSSTTNDRRFFARTGELLYLMLCRSAKVDTLRPLLIERLLNVDTPFNKLVGILQGEPQLTTNLRPGCYLPSAKHPAFDRLAEDWISLLQLDLPVYDAIPHLVAVTGLNIVLYQLERAAETLGRSDPISFVCEIVSPKRSVIRDLAANSFQENNALPLQAVQRLVRSIAETDEWQKVHDAEVPGLAAVDLLSKRFDWPDTDEPPQDGQTPDQLLNALVDKATGRHRQHVGKIHATWARLIGLSSRRSSRRIRYAPTDRILKTLVVCCVEHRIEYKYFLQLLFDRYGLIIGHQQADDFVVKGAADQKDFEENARRLEERLASLGLLKRLSDSCAYVENPFKRKVHL
jgi:hypothetical protein